MRKTFILRSHSPATCATFLACWRGPCAHDVPGGAAPVSSMTGVRTARSPGSGRCSGPSHGPSVPEAETTEQNQVEEVPRSLSSAGQSTQPEASVPRPQTRGAEVGRSHLKGLCPCPPSPAPPWTPKCTASPSGQERRCPGGPHLSPVCAAGRSGVAPPRRVSPCFQTPFLWEQEDNLGSLPLARWKKRRQMETTGS